MMTCLGQFGDSRLERGAFLLGRLLCLGQSGISLRTLGGDRAGEVRLDRFLKNRARHTGGDGGHGAATSRDRFSLRMAGTCPAMTVEQHAAGISPYRGARGRAG